jgi:protein-ribulosamine 3-kinase
MIPQEITDSLNAFFSTKYKDPSGITRNVSLSGGCINRVHRIQAGAGDFCIKYNHRERFPEMFTSEADGLALLKSAGEIRVPKVVCTGDAGPYSYILLEFIDSGRKSSVFMQDFGRSLARLHRHTAAYFGHNRDNYMGSLPQSNKKHSDWISFFIEERLRKQVLLAEGCFSSSDLDAFERVYSRLGELLPEEPPALIHGDLWGGNYMVSAGGKACLIDPAAHYAHREADIAMTTLFGGFEEQFYDSYQEEYPMEKGWRRRLELYQLYPLLIHLNLFGTGYLGSVKSIIRKF